MTDSTIITVLSIDTGEEGTFELWQELTTGSYLLSVEGVEAIGLTEDVIAALDTIIKEVK